MSIKVNNYRGGFKLPLAAALTAVVATNAYAYKFNIGEAEAQLDSTLSLGTSIRLEDPSSRLISSANGGSKNSANYDDGNLNFEKHDQISTVFKGTHEFEFTRDNYGGFMRGRYWHDFVIKDRSMEHRDIPDEAIDEIGEGAKLMDAFVYGDFFVGERPLTVRLGRQVISWGESLFIQGGLNVINPFDVTAFRAPGAEIKDGFLATNKLYGNFAISEEVSVEAYIDMDWQRTEIDPCGTFWAAADFAGRGCDYALATTGKHAIDRFTDNKLTAEVDDVQDILIAYREANIALENGTGTAADLSTVGFTAIEQISGTAGLGGLLALRADPALATNLRIVQRMADDTPDDSKLQFGSSVKWFAPSLNNTEFGLYYIRYHSKLPFLAPQVTTTNLIPIIPNVGNTTTTTEASYINPNVDITDLASMTKSRSQRILVPAAQGYKFVYPEDIDLFGFSFSTSIEEGMFQGLAIAGEWSIRPNAPLQQALPVFLNRGLFTQGTTDLVGPAGAQTAPCPTATCLPFLNSDNELISWSEHQMHQFQVSFLYSWPEVWGAAQAILASEVGMIWLPELEDYDGNPVYNPDGSLRTDEHDLALDVSAHSEVFVTDTSWGIRNRAGLIYNNVFAGVNLVPQLSLNYDVDGYAPGPGAAFTEGAMALGLSVTASYLNKYSATLGITKFYGSETSPETTGYFDPSNTVTPDNFADNYNLVQNDQVVDKYFDRDFASFSVAVSF